MGNMEQIELDNHRKQLLKDMNHLVEKYRAIFDWDIPEVDQHGADQLIVTAVRAALDQIAKELAV